ncbi:hypothetical protein TW95_gp0569 [Pandoravirus inopinatum]|uniref:Uncharacterized protein n=1 Tax=Pandoravirus inopinatum TaxID=1605721 RepID=A0A0B5IX49_9VIRU|nr:hypothetical protein TW95_gp0569 [Pandoravirus inopinatum]AJF97303.1 hypothetical protein [Pandoravirus inopinatum]
MTSSQRVLVLWAVAVGLFVIVASAEAPPRTGCGARAYADSCVDACCAWCPATAANVTVIALARLCPATTNNNSDDKQKADTRFLSGPTAPLRRRPRARVTSAAARRADPTPSCVRPRNATLNWSCPSGRYLA